ncbi:MAG: [FeFe] hydrogenase H-cluster radical SAM maturase HydG [Thermoguttaceae bacterium]
MDTTLSPNAVNFIDEANITKLASPQAVDPQRLRDVIAKSLSKTPLNLDETAVLLAADSPDECEQIFEAARKLKRTIYGNRIVLFAPLYVGNHCTNDCQYCGFRRSLRTAVRRTLADDELVREVEGLEKQGHKRLILVFGEHPDYSPEFIANSVQLCYGVRVGNGEIRRININAAPQTIEGFRTVKASGIGTYQIFQETYHQESYATFHPAPSHKSNYMWRLDAMDRAMLGGCDDVGLGVLFGLYDWKFEVLAMIRHALHLQERFGVGPHTISFPRIQAAHGLARDFPYRVTDEQFKRLVAILRLAVPYTGLVMTARESPAIRNDVIAFGVSQIDAGTRLEIGSYSQEKPKEQELSREQFAVGDRRDLDEVIGWLLQHEYVPSFCTSCYRLGRTGEHFMELAIPGFIGNFCTPNAILTLAEYLADYASPETRAAGEALIARELGAIPEEKRSVIIERLKQIQNGTRDLYF